ncbi:MAG: LL-diaminopimelate aminotransferase [Spirochaetota bacterium]
MIRINENYKKLHSTYLFTNIARKVKTFQEAHPDREIIRLGIGDVTKALPAACIEAFHRAVDEMAADASFKGYGPEQGYDFLREAIAEYDFRARGAGITPDEIFVSDGAKCDTGNIQEIFSRDIRVAVPDPVYPVYVDTNVMAGRTALFKEGRYEGLLYLESTDENDYVPDPPEETADLIYLCFPNNPTGAIATKEQLKKWVDYAREHRALILFDAAYEAFIRDAGIPHSIYEIEGAREVAVEFRSYSKTAGFTGTRCAFVVIPKECLAWDSEGIPHPIHSLWNRRHTTKFNGVSYPVQKAAAAIYTPQGKRETKALIDYYLDNARIIKNWMAKLGYRCMGGDNSPYIWVKTDMDSWKFFETLLEKAGVVCTPGSGFGRCGEGYIRISAFNSRENVEKAMDRIVKALGN